MPVIKNNKRLDNDNSIYKASRTVAKRQLKNMLPPSVQSETGDNNLQNPVITSAQNSGNPDTQELVSKLSLNLSDINGLLKSLKLVGKDNEHPVPSHVASKVLSSNQSQSDVSQSSPRGDYTEEASPVKKRRRITQGVLSAGSRGLGAEGNHPKGLSGGARKPKTKSVEDKEPKLADGVSLPEANQMVTKLKGGAFTEKQLERLRKQHEKVDKYQEAIDTIKEHIDLLQKQLLTEKKEKQKEQVRADIEENKKKIEAIKSSKKTLERKIKKEKEDEDWTDKYRENLKKQDEEAKKKQEDEKKKPEGKEEPKPEHKPKKHPLGKEKVGDDLLRDARFKNDYHRSQEDVEKFITNNQQSEENDKKLKRKLDYLNELADYFDEAHWGFPGGHFGQMAPGEGKEEHLPEEPKQEEEEQPLYQEQSQEENIPELPEEDEDSIPDVQEPEALPSDVESSSDEDASPSDGEETTSSNGESSSDEEEDVPQFDYSGVSKSTILVILGQLKSLIKQGDILLKKIVNNNIQSSSRDLDTITDEVTELIKLKDFLLGHLGQIKAKGQELGNYLQNILSSILGGYIENLTTYLKRYAQLNREQINGISQEGGLLQRTPNSEGIVYRKQINGTGEILSDAVRRINKFDKKYLL